MTPLGKQFGAVLMALVMITSTFVIFAGSVTADSTDRGDSGDDVTGDVGGDGNSGIGNGNDNGGRPDDRGPPDDRGRPDNPGRPGDGGDDDGDSGDNSGDSDSGDSDAGDNSGDSDSGDGDAGDNSGDGDAGDGDSGDGEIGLISDDGDDVNDRNSGRSGGRGGGMTRMDVVSGDIEDTHILVGEAVEISFTVENSNSRDRRYSAVLTADSDVIGQERVMVQGGDRHTFTFVVSFDKADDYKIMVRGDSIGRIYVYDDDSARGLAMAESNR